MKQLSLFENESIDFYDRLQNTIDKIVESHDLPQNSIYLYSNLSTKTCEEKSKSICIFEPDYPPNPMVKEKIGKNFVILKLEQRKDAYVLYIRPDQADMIDTPDTATVKKSKSAKPITRVIFQQDDFSIFEYIKDNILYCLANYESKNSFGCCSRFIECSDAKKCVHENKVYSMGCKYRANLDMGKIFYGKNKNI